MGEFIGIPDEGFLTFQIKKFENKPYERIR